MNLLLYIQITETPEEVKYHSPIVSTIKNKNLDITLYDIDNHSEPFIIGAANKLLSEARQTIIFIETTPKSESNFSKLMSLLTYLLDNPEGIEIYIKGNNPRLKKMLSVFPQLTITENTYEIEQMERNISKNWHL